jgi:hypothetical protein
MKAECLHCGAATQSVYLCNQHAAHLARTLARLGGLADELRTSAHKLDHMGAQVGPSAKVKEAPLPMNEAASKVASKLQHTLLVWTHRVAKLYGRKDLASFKAGDMARYLATHLDEYRAHQPVGALNTEILAIVKTAMRVIDAPPDTTGMVYAGPCGAAEELADGTLGEECQTMLWGVRGQAWIVCPRCGAQWNIKERRRAALAAAENLVETADTISRALSAHDVEVTPGNIYTWKQRGKLAPAGWSHGDHGAPLYRVGDVLDLALKSSITKSG